MSMERLVPPTPEMIQAHPGQVWWGGVFIDPRRYSSSSGSDNSIPYICPRSEYGYKPDIRLPRYGSIEFPPPVRPPPPPPPKPEFGYKTFNEYVQGRGHNWKPYVPYNGSARTVQFPTMQSMGHAKPQRRSLWRSLFGCFCGRY
ncbi:hypothetical protein TWF703_005991 [Orbilia oligospora]|uniref:Uncharacterized protein n=1 Tax=Orbilia oligospora TaxID=2813651 RepID=A0A7C8NKF4_ORBOL|nr:hypothetical protein TWF703_005991 [Orbilia oligospora]